MTIKFQFPSSGKLLPNRNRHVRCISHARFQFPSSGKLLPNKRTLRISVSYMNVVSIPFKRETSSKLALERCLEYFQYLFQFPSSGKLLPNSKSMELHGLDQNVSIPFKRETSSKQGFRLIVPLANYNKVSIPFKRETSSKPVYGNRATLIS